MSSRVSRRSFLKISTGAASALGFASLARQDGREPYVAPPEEALPGEAIWYASTCRQCRAGCGLIARVINGRPRKLEGNPAHPLNRGKLCARGQAGLNHLYNPDRLQNAVRQVGGRNSRRFEAIPWDVALLEVLKAIESIADHRRIAFLVGDISNHLAAVVDMFLEALGARPALYFDIQSDLEGRAALSALSDRWFGEQRIPIFDLAHADVIYSFGANFLETWLSPVSQSVDYGIMRQGRPSGRGFLAQFEARLSLTAAAADEWIPAQLGTEGLIALALGRIIVEENLGRVGSHRPYAHFYRGVEPGALAETAGIPIGRLQQLARFFAEAQSPLAIPGGVLSGLSNGEQSMDAVMALNVIMRRIGREGGVFLAQSPPRQRFAATEHSATFHELDELSDAMRKGEIDLLFIYGTNPLFELPIWAGLHEGLKRVSKIVSFSSQVDETTLWADLVLPDHTYLESWGYHIPSPGADRPVVSSLQPVVTPLYDTRATADVLLTLASSLGGPIAEALPWSSEIAFLEEASEELFDSSLGSYDARTPGGFWSKWRQSGGWWSEKSLRREPNLVSYPEDAIMIPDAWFAGNEEKYPFHLLPYPSITLSDGRGANHPLLQEVPDPMTTARWGSWIEMNPATAASMGLKENQIVRVISHNSEIEAPVLLYSGIRPDTVAMPLGQGHSSYGRFADGRGVNAINLITSLAATLSVELLWASTRVRIEPTHRFHKIARLESLAGGGRESIR